MPFEAAPLPKAAQERADDRLEHNRYMAQRHSDSVQIVNLDDGMALTDILVQINDWLDKNPETKASDIRIELGYETGYYDDITPKAWFYAKIYETFYEWKGRVKFEAEAKERKERQARIQKEQDDLAAYKRLHEKFKDMKIV